jgi:hypothetical protein
MAVDYEYENEYECKNELASIVLIPQLSPRHGQPR